MRCTVHAIHGKGVHMQGLCWLGAMHCLNCQPLPSDGFLPIFPKNNSTGTVFNPQSLQPFDN
jgi:hypothetical protein